MLELLSRYWRTFVSRGIFAIIFGVLAAAPYSIGIPKDSVVWYETAIKADKFLVVAHGTADEVAKAKDILKTAGAAQVDVHSGIRGDIAG